MRRNRQTAADVIVDMLEARRHEGGASLMAVADSRMTGSLPSAPSAEDRVPPTPLSA